MERRRRNKDLFGRRGRESVLQVQNPKGRGRWTGLFYSIRFYSDSMGGGLGFVHRLQCVCFCGDTLE